MIKNKIYVLAFDGYSQTLENHCDSHHFFLVHRLHPATKVYDANFIHQQLQLSTQNLLKWMVKSHHKWNVNNVLNRIIVPDTTRLNSRETSTNLDAIVGNNNIWF